MRWIAIVGACAFACALGAVQGVASVALRARAQAPAWMATVSPGLALRVDRLSPDLPMPLPLRLVLARRALARDDLAYATAVAATVPFSRDRDALEGDLAERRGDREAAVRHYLAAGDLLGIDAAIRRLQAAGRYAAASELAEAVVARLETDRSQADALAQAYYGLGTAREAAAYAVATDPSQRRRLELRALQAYERAAKLAPYAMRYLIAMGNQRINVGDVVGARRDFVRARDVDPTSAEPWTGLGDVALRSGDRAGARALLARARALAPQSDAVRRLASEIGG